MSPYAILHFHCKVCHFLSIKVLSMFWCTTIIISLQLATPEICRTRNSSIKACISPNNAQYHEILTVILKMSLFSWMTRQNYIKLFILGNCSLLSRNSLRVIWIKMSFNWMAAVASSCANDSLLDNLVFCLKKASLPDQLLCCLLCFSTAIGP